MVGKAFLKELFSPHFCSVALEKYAEMLEIADFLHAERKNCGYGAEKGNSQILRK